MNKQVAIIIQNISHRYGTERAVINLANMLAKIGKYDVSIISIFSEENDMPGYPVESEVVIKSLCHDNSKALSRYSAYNKLSLYLHKKYINYDYVIGTDYAIGLAMLSSGINAKQILCEHVNYEFWGKYRNFLKGLYYNRLDALVLLTKRDAEKYYYVDKAKRFVIHNSNPFKSSNTSACNSKQIIAVGRLAHQKGFDLLIEVASKIKNDIPDWHISIFGEGPDLLKLKQLIEKYDVGSFVFLKGHAENICEEYLKSSLYVMSSRFEGLPMTLIEAQTCGLPIVSFDCPEGPSEVIHNGNDGFLVPVDDLKSMAECIVKLAKDDATRIRLGKNAALNAKMYSEKEILKDWETLFTNIESKK